MGLNLFPEIVRLARFLIVRGLNCRGLECSAIVAILLLATSCSAQNKEPYSEDFYATLFVDNLDFRDDEYICGGRIDITGGYVISMREFYGFEISISPTLTRAGTFKSLGGAFRGPRPTRETEIIRTKNWLLIRSNDESCKPDSCNIAVAGGVLTLCHSPASPGPRL